jgi:hypothetical protein
MAEEAAGAASAPTTEAAPVAATGSADGAPPSPQPSQEPKLSVRQKFDHFILGRPVPSDAAPASVAATDEGGDGKPEDSDKTEEAAKPGQKREVTDEEFARAVQAETDRRAAKAAQAKKEEDRKRLLRDDPEAFAAQELANEEAVAQLTSHAGLVISAYDEQVLTPVIAALPEKEREALIEAGIVGLDGRGAAVSKAIEVIKRSEFERGKTEGAKDAEQKLRKNPAALKQVLVGEREDRDEPDLAPAGGAPAAKVDGNTALRNLYRATRGG